MSCVHGAVKSFVEQRACRAASLQNPLLTRLMQFGAAARTGRIEFLFVPRIPCSRSNRSAGRRRESDVEPQVAVTAVVKTSNRQGWAAKRVGRRLGFVIKLTPGVVKEYERRHPVSTVSRGALPIARWPFGPARSNRSVAGRRRSGARCADGFNEGCAGPVGGAHRARRGRAPGNTSAGSAAARRTAENATARPCDRSTSSAPRPASSRASGP
jgi:hypothetical protein